jgi:hypothetical protein
MLLVPGLFQSSKSYFLLHINNVHLPVIPHQPIVFTLQGLEVIMSLEMNLVKFIVLLSQDLNLFITLSTLTDLATKYMLQFEAW